MFARPCALSRKTLRVNAHARILLKHKGAELQSPKGKSRLHYSTPLGAADIKGPPYVPLSLQRHSFKPVPNEYLHSFKSVPNEYVPNEWG